MTKTWELKNVLRGKLGLDLNNQLEQEGKTIDPDISVFSSNCTGSLILHELHMRFNSPFVNLWIRPNDYIRLLANLKEYLQMPLQFIEEKGYHYPVAMLGDVKIFFQHYKTEEEAREKWESRCQRINYDKIKVIMVQRGTCTYEDLVAFDALPYQDKVCFTYKEYPEIQSAFYIKGFEKKQKVGHLYEFENIFSLKKYYDQFDVISFLGNSK